MAANIRSLLFLDVMRFAGGPPPSLAEDIRAIQDAIIQARAFGDLAMQSRASGDVLIVESS